MHGYTNDPVADFLRHDKELQRELDKRPRCAYCNEPIQDDAYYDINGECVCEDCLIEHHRKWVDDYVE